MENIEQVSIIIPVYNAVKTIERCLCSVMNQTYSNIEIIIVNDGSTDETELVIEQLKTCDTRIKIINKENGGPSDARNAGLYNANGKYLMFVDADDVISSEMVGTMVNCMEAKKLDLAVCRIRKDISLDEKKGIRCSNRLEFLSKKDVLHNIKYLMDNEIFNAVCNKIYLLEKIKENHVSFNTMLDMGEDLQFNLAYIRNVSKMEVIPDELYYYVTQDSYLTNKYRENMFRKRCVSTDLLVSFLKENGIDANWALFFYMKLLYADVIQEIHFKTTVKKRYAIIKDNLESKQIKKIFREYVPENFYQRIMFWILKSRNIYVIDFFSYGLYFLKKYFGKKIKRASV